MTAVDKIRAASSIAVANGTASDNVRAITTLENNKRTERVNLVVTGQVDITVAGAGLRNGGSILGALRDIGFTDGGTDKVQTDARLARFIAEVMAPSALPATRLAGAGIQAATQLREVVPLWLCAARTAQPNESKYVEVNKQLALQAFVTPQKLIGNLVSGAPTGTITNLNVTVEQVYDDLVNTPPWLTIYQRQLAQNVTSANTQFRIDLRGSRFIRGIAIQQDTDQGDVSDIINNLVLRGDAFSVYGDRPIPFQDLVDMQSQEYGGAFRPGYLFIDFARYGRLGTLWNPYQDTNLRLELGVQPSGGGATGSLVRVAVIEYERTAATADPLPITI